jgi:glycosyltransferase involved in cell wall biosynthesis
MAADEHYVATSNWRMTVPDTPFLGRMVCVPTVHPIGDRRVVRCAQAVFDAGYGIHYVWLGGTPGTTEYGERLRETRLPIANSFLGRMRSLIAVTKHAWLSDADMWHIHDYYMLPIAWAWSVTKKRPVIYDVHEYYPEYYADRMPGPKRWRRALEKVISAIEQTIASRLGGANVVSERLAERFRKSGIAVATTPNYPALNSYPDAGRTLEPSMLKRAIHTGTLNSDYGCKVLIETATELLSIAPDVEMIVIARYPSSAAKEAFEQFLANAGTPKNLRVVDPMPSHELGKLLATCGIGLSAIQDVGQNALAVQTKLYEYVTVGLAVVASDLVAARQFMEAHGVAAFVKSDDPKAYANAIANFLGSAGDVSTSVNRCSSTAIDELSWELVCAPRLQSLFHSISAEPQRRLETPRQVSQSQNRVNVADSGYTK